MWIQPKAKPLQPSTFFADGRASRLPVANTVARGNLREDELLFTGLSGGQYADRFPFPIGKEELDRGQNRFEIFCTPCHGKVGDGKGMIAQRGLALRTPPASYHTDRLRKMPTGYFFDVVSNGTGAMYSYAQRVDVEDRWKIVAYIRTLQLSQNARPENLTAEERSVLDGKPIGIGMEAAAKAGLDKPSEKAASQGTSH
jgi:mono/diheme cytochrome c family protein